MKMKEESSFLQGVESRLDSLFAEDTQPPKDKDSDLPQATVQEVAPDVEEDIWKITDTKETSHKADISTEPIQTQDKSSFISEIEKRFSAIFGEDDKDVSAVTDTAASDDLKKVIAQAEQAEPDDMKKIIARAEQEENKKSDQFLGDLSSPPSSIYHSPLKDMKSIILSIEWEINDHILEQLDDEINKLYLLYTGDRIIQGFLRILRFMGRYIRVRGVRSNQDSINLLLFVYDHLENIMVSERMTEAKKHIILIDNIKKYREWAEVTDRETLEEGQIPGTEVREVKSSDVEPLEDKFLDDQKEEIKPLIDSRAAQEEPIAEAIIDKAADEVPFLREPDEKDKTEFAVKEPDIIGPTPSTPVAEILPSAFGEEVEKAITAMKDRPSQEAFIYALEEIKKNFQSELDALKEEIRLLKSAR
jgi:hypothetical protein